MTVAASAIELRLDRGANLAGIGRRRRRESAHSESESNHQRRRRRPAHQRALERHAGGPGWQLPRV